MKAFINQRFLDQTRFDSAAPAGSAVVAHEVEQDGEYELAVARKGKAVVKLPLVVGSERPGVERARAVPEGPSEAGLQPALSVDLFKLARPGATLPELPTLGGTRWVSFTSSQPLLDHHVLLRRKKGAEGTADVFDSRRLGPRSLFAVTLIRPGRYSLEDSIGGARAEIVVAYPKVGKTAYRPPEPLEVEVTERGFGGESFPLSPAQGMVFRFRAESRIQIELVEPDDGPGAERKPAARFSSPPGPPARG